jgi:hypothetical protein
VFSCRDGMTGFGRTPVLPRAILVRALSAQMPRPPPRIIATGYVDTRRRPMSQMRKERPFAEDGRDATATYPQTFSPNEGSSHGPSHCDPRHRRGGLALVVIKIGKSRRCVRIWARATAILAGSCRGLIYA